MALLSTSTCPPFPHKPSEKNQLRVNIEPKHDDVAPVHNLLSLGGLGILMSEMTDIY